MPYDNNHVPDRNTGNTDSVFSKRLKAGKRRTYFFDVKTTRGNDYFLTITESKKRFNDNGYDRHKIFLYKEDFNKFIHALTETVNYVKTELMPDFDFDSFNHENHFDREEHAEQDHPLLASPDHQESSQAEPISEPAPTPAPEPAPAPTHSEDVDSW